MSEYECLRKDSYSDIRVIAATNRNLEEMVKKKKFRKDLYYHIVARDIKEQPSA
nr:sigma 54-interacting transcriptional regulator [uncultured Treponema sp.]